MAGCGAAGLARPFSTTGCSSSLTARYRQRAYGLRARRDSVSRHRSPPTSRLVRPGRLGCSLVPAMPIQPPSRTFSAKAPRQPNRVPVPGANDLRDAPAFVRGGFRRLAQMLHQPWVLVLDSSQGLDSLPVLQASIAAAIICRGAHCDLRAPWLPLLERLTPAFLAASDAALNRRVLRGLLAALAHRYLGHALTAPLLDAAAHRRVEPLGATQPILLASLALYHWWTGKIPRRDRSLVKIDRLCTGHAAAPADAGEGTPVGGGQPGRSDDLRGPARPAGAAGQGRVCRRAADARRRDQRPRRP
jgi:hypothetical protein